MTAIAKSAKRHPAAKKCCGWEEPAMCGYEAEDGYQLDGHLWSEHEDDDHIFPWCSNPFHKLGRGKIWFGFPCPAVNEVSI